MKQRIKTTNSNIEKRINKIKLILSTDSFVTAEDVVINSKVIFMTLDNLTYNVLVKKKNKKSKRVSTVIT